MWWSHISRKAPKQFRRLVLNSKPLLRLLGHEYFGHDQLDRKILSYLDASKPGYFVEIGANNGIAQSNTKHLELFYGWNGLLVEPWQPNFESLPWHRSRKTKFVHSACVAFDYKLPSVNLLYSNLMTIALNLETDKVNPENWAKSGEIFLTDDERVISFEAPARTLSSILDEVRAPKTIDFFSLDVEGAEMEVLRGINFEKYSFQLICIETDSPNRIEEFMMTNGYQMVGKVSFHDYLFSPIK